MPIRLMENFRAVFYAPYYATYALGFYAREGLEVELLTSDAPGDAVPKLMDGTIDLTWGGPMRVMKAHDQDRHSPLVSFCEVVSHDPFFLIGRKGAQPFRLGDLQQMKFASVAEVPTPWMCLQHDLREQGIDPDALPRIADRAMTRNYHALQAGDLDMMQAFEPFVSMAEQELLSGRAEGDSRPLARPLSRRRPVVARDPHEPAGLRAPRAEPAFRWIHRPHARL